MLSFQRYQTLFLSLLYNESSWKSTPNSIILGITFPVRREELRARRPVGHQMNLTSILMAQDGEFRSFRDQEEVPGAAPAAASTAALDWRTSRELQEFEWSFIHSSSYILPLK